MPSWRHPGATLVNTHPSEPERIRVAGAAPFTKASGRPLTGNALDAHNTFAEPERVRPTTVTFTGKDGQVQIDLPAHSILVVALE